MPTATIASVEAIPLEAPLEEPFGYSQAWVETRSALLVRIEATDGTVGWGECWGPIEGTRETVDEFLGPHLVGENPLAVERLYEDLYDLGRAAYQSVVPLPAISGIDVALWDLKGKLLDQSVASLLGGARRDSVRAYATGHYFKHNTGLDGQYRRISEEARANAKAFGAVKAKIGLQLLGYGYEEDIELVRRIRDAVGPDPTLMVDANYAYDTATARTVGRALEDLDVHWFEEPVPPENVTGYAHLRDVLDLHVAGGECHTPAELSRMLERGDIDVAQPDVCNVGGLTPAGRIANTADTHGVKVVPHVWGTEVALGASLNLIGTIPGDPWLEFDRSSNPLREDIAIDPVTADERGHVDMPDGPGLGVELDEGALSEYRVEQPRVA